MRKYIVKLVLLLLVIVLVAWVQSQFLGSEAVMNIGSSYGYLGLFVISIISGFNVIVPVPAIAFYPSLVELGFYPVLIIGIISLGMVIGDSLGFLIGKTGKEMLNTNISKKINAMVARWEKKHRWLPYIFLFLYAAFSPIPNELVVIPMALAGYRYLPMLVVLFLGNIVFNTLGAYGIMSIFSLL